MTDAPRPDGPAVFAIAATVAAALAFAAALVVAATAGSDTAASGGTGEQAEPDGEAASDDAVADPAADPAEVVDQSAAAMGEVESVEFAVERSGAPVYIDEFESIELDRVRGQFTVPNSARALLTVTVDDSVDTEIAAVAIDEEVWISNPVTGDFETLPAGYDIDPSRFFDPAGGWRPLLEELRGVELVGIDDRGGERYHVRGIAPSAQVTDITVGLVRDQDVELELWIHPDTYLVTAARFATELDDATSEWELELDDYGAEFSIEPPANVRET